MHVALWDSSSLVVTSRAVGRSENPGGQAVMLLALSVPLFEIGLTDL